MTNKRQCPNCQSTNRAEIIFGLIADMGEIEELIKNKKIVLGGCIVTGNDPKWECNECLTRWPSSMEWQIVRDSF